MTSLLYLFTRLENGGEGLSARERQSLAELRGEYLELLPIPKGHVELLLFRLARAEPPTTRALRRQLDDVLAIE
jgi:hypothetical protein